MPSLTKVHGIFVFLKATSLDNLYHHLIYNSLKIVCSLCCDYIFRRHIQQITWNGDVGNTVKKVALLVYYKLQYHLAVELKAQRLAVTVVVAVLGTQLQPAQAQGPAQAIVPALELAWSQTAVRKAEMAVARRVAAERITAGRTMAERVAVD
jgi:hypothetical protein